MVLQLLVVAAVLAIVGLSFGRNVLAPQKQAEAPARLEKLELVNVVGGDEALRQIERLHGTSINLASAYIAEYANNGERVTAWVGTAENGTIAAELTRRMVAGIGRGGSGFSNLQQLSIDGQEVFQVDGPDGKHFFYNHMEMREKVIWLSIEAGDFLPIMKEALKTF